MLLAPKRRSKRGRAMSDPNAPYTQGSWFTQRDAEIASQSRNGPAAIPEPVDPRWLRAKRWIRGAIFSVVALAFLAGALADEINGHPFSALVSLALGAVLTGVIVASSVLRDPMRLGVSIADRRTTAMTRAWLTCHEMPCPTRD